MLRKKQLEIPPKVAKEFVRDMRAFFKAKNQLAGDEIAAMQAHSLKKHLQRGPKLRIADAKEPLYRMRDQA